MADHSTPDYELDETLALETVEQYRVLFDETRQEIVDLLLERAATIKDLADVLDRPKGTIGHHVAALEDAGLIRVVRTKKVRAIEAKYYGRTARTYLLSSLGKSSAALPNEHFLTTAADEYAKATVDDSGKALSTLRYARIPSDKVDEWNQRLVELTTEFTREPRGGDTTYGLLVAFYPTDRAGFADGDDS